MKNLSRILKWILLVFTILFGFILRSNAQLLLPKDTTRHQRGMMTISGASEPIVAIPVSKGVINDMEDIFTKSQEDSLLNLVKTYSKFLDSNQITVVTIKEFEPYKSIEEVANTFATAWDLGGDKDNGVMIIFSADKKQARLQVGQNLSKIITDEGSKKIIDFNMVPEFINGNYCKGTYNALLVTLRLITTKK